MRLGDYSANIIVDEKELEEYEVVVNSDATKATCWVASEVGKVRLHTSLAIKIPIPSTQKFTVQWKCHSQRRLIASEGKVVLDGVTRRYGYIHPGRLGNDDTMQRSSLACGAKQRDFIFSQLQLTDCVTTIGRNLFAHQHGNLQRLPFNHNRTTDLSQVDHVVRKHEKAVKKLLAHCIGFGPERERKRSAYYSKFTANQDRPLKFVFKYRPLDILQANGIVFPPVVAGPAARLSAQPDGTLVQNSETGVLDRIEMLENELKRLRSQVADTKEDRKPKRIKKEHPVAEKRHSFTSKEVIDLT
ncbi:hypothetical protein ID866_8596 [Astraeus odoratus]|nr:hypothetical protein ID866_8596 [Astraeus odoratus]